MSEEPNAAYRQLLEEHAQLQARAALLQRVLHLYGAPEDFDAVFDGLLDAALDYYGATAGALYMLDADADELYFAAARGPKAQEVLALDATVRPGEGLAGACFADREVLAVSDVRGDERFAREVSGAVHFDVRSALTAPIVCEDAALGVIQVLNRRGEGGFSAEEVAVARQLGRQAGELLGLGLRLQELRLAAAGAAAGEGEA